MKTISELYYDGICDIAMVLVLLLWIGGKWAVTN